MGMKDKITPAPKQQAASEVGVVRLPAPIVKVGAPQIDVNVDAPNVTIDSKEFAAAINKLSDSMQLIAQQQNAILEAIKTLAGRDTKVEVKPADVKLPATQRPRSFYVELDKEDGETVGMRISADQLN